MGGINDWRLTHPDLGNYLDRIEERQDRFAQCPTPTQNADLNSSVGRLLDAPSLRALWESYVKQTGCIGFLVNHTPWATPENVATIFWWGDGEAINRAFIDAHLRAQGFHRDPCPFADLSQKPGASYTLTDVRDLFPDTTETSYSSILEPAQLVDWNAYPICIGADYSLVMIAMYDKPLTGDFGQKVRRSSEHLAESLGDSLRKFGVFAPESALSLLAKRPKGLTTGTLIVASDGNVIYDHASARMFDRSFEDGSLKCVTAQARYLYRTVQELGLPDGRPYILSPELSPWRDNLTLEVTRGKPATGPELLHVSVRLGGFPDFEQLDLIWRRFERHVQLPAHYSSQMATPVTSTHASKYTLGQVIDDVILRKGQRFFIITNNRPRALVRPLCRRSLDRVIVERFEKCLCVSLGAFQKQFVLNMQDVEAGKTLLLVRGKQIVAAVETVNDNL